MAIEKEKCVVVIEYEVKEAGTAEVVDSNKGSEPLEFLTGVGQVIIGLENALVGMEKGESGDILVKASDAYGELNSDALQTLPVEQFDGVELAKGLVLYGQGEQGETVQVVVKSFTDKEVTIDFNHPLAGKDLLFNVTIMEVRDATEEEIATSMVGGNANECCTTDGGCGCN
ncbi:MAG: peptidylprolyl isomerase [Sulfurovum sp.]|nr:peptidylprolyl isomerase [Sulfurovaceae bacterium]